MQKYRFLVMVCAATLAAQGAMADETKLKASEVKTLFPVYLDAVARNQASVITGEEWNVLRQLQTIAAADDGAENPVWNRALIRELTQQYTALSEPKAHEKQLKSELEAIAASFNENSKSFECSFRDAGMAVASVFANSRTVACTGVVKGTREGCYRTVKIALFVDSASKQPKQAIYDTHVVYPAYALDDQCPG